jgi:hypothetical protein
MPPGREARSALWTDRACSELASEGRTNTRGLRVFRTTGYFWSAPGGSGSGCSSVGLILPCEPRICLRESQFRRGGRGLGDPLQHVYLRLGQGVFIASGLSVVHAVLPKSSDRLQASQHAPVGGRRNGPNVPEGANTALACCQDGGCERAPLCARWARGPGRESTYRSGLAPVGRLRLASSEGEGHLRRLSSEKVGH